MRKMMLVPVDIYEKYFPRSAQSPTDVETKLQQQARFMHEIPMQKQIEPQPNQLPLSSDFIEQMNVKYRPRARLLVGHLEENKHRIQWSDLGELIYHGRVIPSSHIVDLIYGLAKPKSAKQPVGLAEFMMLLKQTNVPREYIANKARINDLDVLRLASETLVADPLVGDDLPPLPATPIVPLRPLVAITPKSISSPAPKRVRKRRQAERAPWNPY
jgi:hypothetical protein